MLPRCDGSDDNRYVTLPCHLPQWPDIKRHLKHMVANNLNCSHKLVSALNDLYVLVHDEDEGVLCHRGVFDGLKKFLHTTATREETVNFFVVSLPCIVQRAVDIEDLQPDNGLAFRRQQQDGELCLSRALVASIIACSFLCLFPHRKFKRHSKLCAINFDDFFRHLTSASQCEKLRCILNYFERIALDPGGPSGTVTFRRQVVPPGDLPCIIDWLTCDQPLCPIQVSHNGKIEDAKSNFIKVNFANAKIGGAVLSTGCVQEEINFCMNPELIAAALFMERMLDNEAIIIHGFETFSQYTGYAKTLQFNGSSFDPAMKASKGNLENALCAIDALHLGRYSSTGKQYSDHLVLRELNKAWVGFQQPWCSGEPAHPGSNRDSVVTSEEYYSAVEALNEDAAGGNHSSPPTEEDEDSACARFPPIDRHGNSSTQHCTRKTPLGAIDPRSCDYGVDTRARSFLVAVSEATEPCSTHLTSEASDPTKTPSSGNDFTHTSPMDVAEVPFDGANFYSDVGLHLCGSSPKSEFSSEFEEYFESMQHQSQSLVLKKKSSQKQCAPVVQSFVGILVTQSFQDGCQEAVDMLPKVETFSCCQPNNLVKPKAVRPSGCDFKFGQGEGHNGKRRCDDLVNLNRVVHHEFIVNGSERVDVDSVTEMAANDNREAEATIPCTHHTSQVAVTDVAEFASNLLRNTYDSAVLNVQARLENQANPSSQTVGDMVDHAFHDAFTAHMVQRRRRTLSEGVTHVGGHGDGHVDSSVLCDSTVPSFIEECLSDEMKVKLMEMVASQQAQAEMQRTSGTGDARRASGGGSAQTASGAGLPQRASSNRGAQRAYVMQQSRDVDGGASVSMNGQTTWNVPAIRIYSEDADLTETVDVQSSGQSLLDETLGSGLQSSFEDGHNLRCNCPHCVCSVDGYVDVMIDDVITETYDAIMENQCDEAKEQLARFTFRSLDGTSEPDLNRFAGRLVYLAMRDAMRLLRRANKHGKRCRHQSQGWAASPRAEATATSAHTDLRYFENEFSQEMRHLTPRKSSLVPSSVPSNIDARRCSLDETRSLQLSNQCSSFRDVVLSDFEDELRNSLVRSPNLHLFESDDGGLLLHSTQRRASEPIHSLKRDSITESTTCVVPVIDVTCDSSAATSTEVVLGWLNSSNWGGHAHREHRPTTPVASASPLNIYVDNLITEVFSTTYMELFDRDLRPALSIPQRKVVDESKAVCDTKLFTRLWHGPRAAHCSPPGGIGSNSNMKLLMSDYFPTPAPFHSLNVMAAVMSGHIVRDAVRAVSTQQRREEPKFLRPIATGNWGCGVSRGDPQLKALLQWAAASRVQVPTMNYYSFSNPQMQQFASVCRKIERRGLTVGELLKVVVDFCHRREDSYHDRERTLFDDICRNNSG